MMTTSVGGPINSHLPFGRRDRLIPLFRQMRSLQKSGYVHASVFNHFNKERSLSTGQNSRPTVPPLSPTGVSSVWPDAERVWANGDWMPWRCRMRPTWPGRWNSLRGPSVHSRPARRWPPVPAPELLDDFNREGLGIEVDFSLLAERVILSLDRIKKWRGKLLTIRVDHGPEYISCKLLECAEKQGVAIQHIQPGQPQQSAYIERHNRAVRHEWLDQYVIESIEEAQDHAKQWLWTYNNDRPNMGIGGITPAQKKKTAA